MLKLGLICAFAAVTTACGAAPIPRGEYHARRAELRKKLDGEMVLFGYAEGADEVYRIGQNSNFYYLSGGTQPGAIILLSPAEEILFVPHRNARREIYNGKRIAPDDADAGAATGFDSVEGPEKFESALRKALDSYAGLHVVGDAANTARLKSLAPFREISDGAPLLAP